MKLTDPIPDYYHTRSEDDLDYLYPDYDSWDQEYDFHDLDDKDLVEVEDEKDN